MVAEETTSEIGVNGNLLHQSFIQREGCVENFEKLVVVRREINRGMMSVIDDDACLDVGICRLQNKLLAGFSPDRHASGLCAVSVLDGQSVEFTTAFCGRIRGSGPQMSQDDFQSVSFHFRSIDRNR